MDVTTSRFPDAPEVLSPRRFAPVKPSEPTAEADKPPAAKPHETDWEPRSSLKFSVTAADVDARFEIHEATSRVIVTMYSRETGEVLREVPSRHVLDVIASVTANGLTVDTTS
jgi:uncharacterized FlaG/YvyC family protein